MEKLPLSDLRFVTLVLNEAESATKSVILVENEPLSIFKFVTLMEKLPLSVLRESILAVAAVTLLEKLEESIFSASILDVIAVILSEKLALGAVNDPLICCSNCFEALTNVFSNSPSAIVILVENEAESDTKFVILVEKLELSAVKEPDISSAI